MVVDKLTSKSYISEVNGVDYDVDKTKGKVNKEWEYYKDKTDLVVTKARGKVASLRFTMVRKKGTHYKYAFHEMAVGDYYSIGDDDNVTSVRVHASRMAKQLDMKFKVSAKDRRVWRVA